MRVLIVAPRASGHHMALHTRLLVREATRRGWQPEILTTPAAAMHPAFALVRAESSAPLRVHMMPEPPPPPGGVLSSIRWQLDYHAAVAIGYRGLPPDARPDTIYVIDLDSIARALALRGSPFGGVCFSGMLMGLGYHRRAMGIGPTKSTHLLQRMMVRRILRLRSLCGVALIDECLAAYHARRPGRHDGKLQLVPDAGEIPGAFASAGARRRAREALGIPADRFVVLAYGSLSARKGVAELIAGVEGHCPRDVAVLLAGRQDPSAQAALAGVATERLHATGRLFISPGFHDAEQERRAFEAADAVWVGYIGFYGSSGVLYQAGSAGLPVIASRAGLVGWVAERHGAGVTCDPSMPRDVGRAIAAVREPASNARFVANARSLAAGHTESRFARGLGDVIDRARQ